VFGDHMVKQRTHTNFVILAARTEIDQLIMMPFYTWAKIEVLFVISILQR
jgi:hypothetical protein